MYDLKHELISLKMQIEEAKKAEQEAQEQKNLLDGKVKETGERNLMNCLNRMGDCFGNPLLFYGHQI